MQMRTLFTESDLISVSIVKTHNIKLYLWTICNIFFFFQAEIQLISVDGSISLHARSLRYGKLENGQFLRVPAGLVKRLPQHYVTLSWGVDIILGRNGGIWITSEI